MAHYYTSASAETYGAVGWHQAYANRDGSLVWDSKVGVTGDPYGDGANAYYRVYKIKATATLSSEQAANVPDKPVITGKVAVSDSKTEGSAKIWSKDAAMLADNTEVPEANLGTTALSFTGINVSSWFNGTAGAKSAIYSDTYFAVMIDGDVHTTNDSVTATLAFSNLGTATA